MFAAIKKFFRRPAGTPAAAKPPPAAAAPTEQKKGLVASNEQKTTSTPTAPRAASPQTGGGTLALAWNVIRSLVPKELVGKTVPEFPESEKFQMPTADVLAQLPQGSVKVSFGELRRAAPVGLFIAGSTEDAKLIDLPLSEILKLLPQEAFACRGNRKQSSVPTDIGNIFGPKGEQLSSLRVIDRQELTQPPRPPTRQRGASAAPAKPEAPAAAAIPLSAPGLSAAVAAAPAPAKSKAGARAAEPASRKPASVSLPLAELSEAWPESIRAELSKVNLKEAKCQLPFVDVEKGLKQGKLQLPWKQVRAGIKPAPVTGSAQDDLMLELPLKIVAPVFLAQCPKPATQKKAEALDQIPDLFSKTGLVAAPAAAAPAPSVQPAAPTTPPSSSVKPKDASAGTSAVPASGKLPVMVASVAAAWPDAIQKQIDKHQLAQATLELPLDVVEAGLKSGKLAPLWKQVFSWLKPAVQSPVAAELAETRVELPLNVVAPLFLEQRSLPQGRKKTSVPESVPDVFSAARSPSSAGAAIPAPAPAAPAPPSAAEPADPKAEPILENTSAKSLAELFGEPEKRTWTPNEIVHQTCRLPGVVGAIIALQDGLLVASCMPPNTKTDTIAAFLPQIFGRMNQYSREFNMGELKSVTFSVENGTLQVFCAGIIYFAALGRPDGPLPGESLRLIATELSRHTK